MSVFELNFHNDMSKANAFFNVICLHIVLKNIKQNRSK